LNGVDLAIYVVIVSSNFTLWYKLGKLEQKLKDLERVLNGEA
jgi:hypothetical protein